MLIHQQRQLDNLIKIFNTSPPLPKKIKQKKQFILLKLPLFMTIFQKKGQQNFQLIVNAIKLTRFQFGQIVLSKQSVNVSQTDLDQQEVTYFQRNFNYILKGTVMMFTVKQNQSKHKNYQPQFYKKLVSNQYFGQKISFGNDKLYQVKAVSTCYVLQLDIKTFYNTFAGHFQYAQLKDKIIFLQNIWMFTDVRRSIIQKILLTAETVRYKKNHNLFKKNDISDRVYIVMEGEIALYEVQENQKVKFLPFCLLGRGQVCGLEEMILEKNFQYGGTVTSEYVEVLIITNQIYQKFLKNCLQKKQTILQQLLEQRQKLRLSSLKYDKQYTQVVEYNRKRQANIWKLFCSKIPSITKNPKIQVQKVELTYVQQLKNPITRQFRIKQIKQRQNRLFNSSSLSALTNKNYTSDKKLLVNYLTKKQKIKRRANQKQLKYQRSLSEKSGIMNQIHVKQSSAVKNHKRKLVHSRHKSVTLVKY